MRRLGTLSFWFQPTQDSDMGACQATGDRSERTILDNDFRSLTLASWTVLDGRCNYPSQFQQHRGNRNWVRFPSPAPDSKGSGPETWVTPRIALPSRIKVCCVALLLWLVCQIAPDPVDHSASKESLYEFRIAKFFGNDPEAPLGSKF